MLEGDLLTVLDSLAVLVLDSPAGEEGAGGAGGAGGALVAAELDGAAGGAGELAGGAGGGAAEEEGRALERTAELLAREDEEGRALERTVAREDEGCAAGVLLGFLTEAVGVGGM